jgi:hypothetical protein
MNNIRTVSAIAAILMAATLVVGGTSATITTTTHSAFAWKKDGQDKYMKGGQDGYKKDNKITYPKQDKKDRQDSGNDGGSKNGNTVTIQVNKQKAKQSGHDGQQEQEGQNTICTHPASNGTCVSEGSEGAATNGGGGGGGGVCNSPLVQASLFSETDGVLVCINPGDLSDPDDKDKCKGQDIDVFIDSVHKCLAEPPK